MTKLQHKTANIEPGKVHYHSGALSLLGVAPTPDPVAISHLERFEAQRGVTLPASVREWYSLPNVTNRPEFHHQESAWGPDSFGMYNWEDDPGYDTWTHGEGPHFDPIAQRGLLPVLFGDRYWAVYLDDGDDPGVVTAWDAFSSTAHWEHGAVTFSEFVYTRIWDCCFFHHPFHMFFEIEPCGPADLQTLEQHWRPRPATLSGDCRRFATADDNQRILLRKSVTGRHARPVTRCLLWAVTKAYLDELSTQIQNVLASLPTAATR